MRYGCVGVPESLDIISIFCQIRKLEFMLADAVSQGCHHVITSGSVLSNHCRTVAVAAAHLNLKCHLILKANIKVGCMSHSWANGCKSHGCYSVISIMSLQDVSEAGCSGNMFLNKMVGAEMYFVPTVAPCATEFLPRMEKLAAKIK